MTNNIIPDSAILLVPPVGDTSDIRPGNKGWVTSFSGDRKIIIELGENLKKGGLVKLIDPFNVKEFSAELSVPSSGIKLKVIKNNGSFIWFLYCSLCILSLSHLLLHSFIGFIFSYKLTIFLKFYFALFSCFLS